MIQTARNLIDQEVAKMFTVFKLLGEACGLATDQEEVLITKLFSELLNHYTITLMAIRKELDE